MRTHLLYFHCNRSLALGHLFYGKALSRHSISNTTPKKMVCQEETGVRKGRLNLRLLLQITRPCQRSIRAMGSQVVNRFYYYWQFSEQSPRQLNAELKMRR